MLIPKRLCAGVFPACLFLLSVVLAADAGAAMTAVRTAQPPKIDGRLTEDCWRSAPPITTFLQANTNLPAKYGSEAWVLYDDAALYIGVRCHEPDMKNLRTQAVARDGKVYHSDSVDIMIDPYAEGNDYYHFVVNASGSVFDRACTQSGFIGDSKWNADVKAASHVGKNGWSCELAIPYYALGLTAKVGSAWRINICREKKFPVENSAIAAKGTFHIAGNFVELKGVSADLSAFLLGIGDPVTTTQLHDGTLRLMLNVPLENATGRAAEVLLESWLISPSGTPFVASEGVALSKNQEKSVRGGPFALSEQGAYTCTIQVSDPITKKPLARRMLAVNVEYVPMAIRLVAPWYRDAIFETQKLEKVLLDVDMRLPADKLTGAALDVSIQKKGETTALQSRTVAAPAAMNRVAFSVAGLPYGHLEIVAVLKGKDGKEQARITHPLRKLPYHKDEVWRDRNMQWRVDGKPFFINGAWSNLDDHMPGNNVFTVFNGQPSEMERLPKDMRFVMCGLMNRLHHRFGDELKTPKLSDEAMALCREFVHSVKDHPNLFAYYLVDEPEVAGATASAYEQVYRFLVEQDPYHPAVISNDTVTGVRNYIRCGDINGLHPYPKTLKALAHNDLSRIVAFMDGAMKIIDASPHKQTIAYLHQGFNYGDVNQTHARVPNYLEYRNQNLLAVICGANGIMQYNRNVQHYPELRIGLPHLTQEFAALGPVIISPTSDVVATSSDNHVRMLVKEYEGELYLFACNVSMTPRTATLTLPGIGKRVKRLNVFSEGRAVALRGDALEDAFGTFEAHVYTTSAKQPSLKTVQAICAEIDAANRARRKLGNLAFQEYEGDGVVIRASSSKSATTRPDLGLWHVVDGIVDEPLPDYLDQSSKLKWKDTTANKSPDWLEIQLPEPHAVGRVVVYPYRDSLKDYAVQAFVNGAWADMDRVSGRKDGPITHAFAPVATDRIRLFVTATNGPHAWVSEVEIYEK